MNLAPESGRPGQSARGRVLPISDAVADGRLSGGLRTLARRTAGMRGTAAGDDLIGRERWQAGPGHPVIGRERDNFLFAVIRAGSLYRSRE